MKTMSLHYVVERMSLKYFNRRIFTMEFNLNVKLIKITSEI